MQQLDRELPRISGNTLEAAIRAEERLQWIATYQAGRITSTMSGPIFISFDNAPSSNVRTFSYSFHGNAVFHLNGIPTPFTVGQFASRCGADKILIDDLLIYYLHRFDRRFNSGFTITSGFRTPEHDARFGSGEGQHTTGRAADFAIAGVTQRDLYEFARYLGFGRDWGFTYRIVRRDGTFATTIHIDTRWR